MGEKTDKTGQKENNCMIEFAFLIVTKPEARNTMHVNPGHSNAEINEIMQCKMQ